MFKACAFYRHQCVDGNGLDSQLGKTERHVDTVFPGFAHTDDAAGTYAEPFGLRQANGLYTVVIGMGRADLREIAARGFDIVMVARDARGTQSAELFTV